MNISGPFTILHSLSTVEETSSVRIKEALKEHAEVLQAVGQLEDALLMEKIKEIASEHFKKCEQDLDTQRGEISSSLWSIKDYSSLDEISTLFKREAEVEARRQIVAKFLNSSIGRTAIADHSWKQLLFGAKKGSSDELNKLNAINQHLQQMCKESPVFEKEWQHLPLTSRNLILRTFQKSDEASVAEAPLYLKNALQWHCVLEKIAEKEERHVSNLFDKCAQLYFQFCKEPEGAVSLLNNVLHFLSRSGMAEKYAKACTVLGALAQRTWPYSELRSWTLSEAIEMASVLEQMCGDEDLAGKNCRMIPILMPERQAVRMYQFSPRLYKRLIRLMDVNLLEGEGLGSLLKTAAFGHLGDFVGGVSEENLHAFLDLVTQLSSECNSTIYKMFDYEGQKVFLASVFQELGGLFCWLRDQGKQASAQRCKELGFLFDKAIAIHFDQPATSEKLRQIPAHQCHLWESIFDQVDYVQTMRVEDVRKKLESLGQLDLVHLLFDNTIKDEALVGLCEAFCKRTPQLEVLFHSWIDKLLHTYGVAIAPSEGFAKVKQLPQKERQLVKKIASVEGLKHSYLKDLLQFALHIPYNGSVTKYMETAAAISTPQILETFQELVRNTPRLLPSLFHILKFHPENLSNLKLLSTMLNAGEFCYLVEEHGTLLKLSDVEMLLKDNGLTERLRALLKIEQEGRFSLLPLFRSKLELLKEPVFEAMAKSREFCSQLAGSPVGIFSDYPIEVLSRRFNESKEECFRLVKMTEGFSKAQCLFLNRLCFKEKECTGVEAGHYLQLCRLYENPRQRHLVDGFLGLYEREEEQLAAALFDLLIQKEEDLVDRLLDMVQGAAIQEVQQLLTLRKTNPNDPVTTRLLAWASSDNIPVIRKIFALQSLPDGHPVLDLLQQEAPGNNVNPLLRSCLVLISRQEETLLKWAISEIGTPAKKNAPILKALSNGHITLAREWVEQNGSEERFWPQLMTIDSLLLQQQLRDLYTSLRRRREVIPKDRAQLLLSFALQLAQQKGREEIAAAWMGKVHFLLMHDERTLLTMLHSCRQSMEENRFTEEEIEAVLKEHSLDISQQVESILRASLESHKEIAANINGQKLTPFTIALAECLVTPGGNINTAVIAEIRSSLAYQRLKTPSVEREYIDRILDTLYHSPAFSERLEIVKAPPERSESRRMVQIALNYNAQRVITDRDAQVAVLSALLWPLRQSSAGSCFATSTAIRLRSSTEDLLQLHENHIMLINQGGLLERNAAGHKAAVCPMPFDEEEYSKQFKDDHIVARMCEYTIASMGVVDNWQLNNLLDKWKGCLMGELKAMESRSKDAAAEIGLMKEPIERCLSVSLKKNVEVRFYGYAHHPDASMDGAWKMIDRTTGIPLARNRSALNSFFRNLFKEIQRELSKEHFTGGQRLILNQLFSDIWPGYIKSPRFLESILNLFDLAGCSNKGLARVNPIPHYHLLAESPLVRYGGGDTTALLTAYLGQKVLKTNLHGGGHPLRPVLRYVERLSRAEKTAARKYPGWMKTMDCFQHAFNLKAGSLLAALDKEGAEVIVSRMEKTLDELLHSSVNEELASVLINAYLRYFDSDFATSFKTAFAQQILSTSKTLGELCRAIVHATGIMTGASDEIKKYENYLNWVVVENAQLRSKIPPYYPVGDTNWTNGITTGYQVDLSSRRCSTTLVDEAEALYTAHWSPGPPANWSVYEFVRATDDISRVYAW